MTDLAAILAEPGVRDLVVDALRSRSTTMVRAARRAAGELEAEHAAGTLTDRRPGSVKVARMLADADRLERAADALATTEPARAPATPPAAANGTKPAGPLEPDPGDYVDDATKAAEKVAKRRTVTAARREARAAALAALGAEEEDDPDDDEVAAMLADLEGDAAGDDSTPAEPQE